MYQQDVKGKKTSPLAGIGMIILIVLSITAAGYVEQLLRQLTGFSYGSMAIWVLAAAAVFFLLRTNIREYRYTLTEGRLFIEARYGDNTRIVHDIALSAAVALGSEQEIFEKYGNGQAYDKVFTAGCPEPLSALAYRKNDEIRFLVFQPDETLRTLISDQIDAQQT